MCPALMLVAIGGEAIGREVGGTRVAISVGVAVGIGVIEGVGVMLGVGVTETTATDSAPSVGCVLLGSIFVTIVSIVILVEGNLIDRGVPAIPGLDDFTAIFRLMVLVSGF